MSFGSFCSLSVGSGGASCGDTGRARWKVIVLGLTTSIAPGELLFPFVASRPSAPTS